MNPIAIIFFLFCTVLGYLIGETVYIALVGLAVSMLVSLIVSMKA